MAEAPACGTRRKPLSQQTVCRAATGVLTPRWEAGRLARLRVARGRLTAPQTDGGGVCQRGLEGQDAGGSGRETQQALPKRITEMTVPSRTGRCHDVTSAVTRGPSAHRVASREQGAAGRGHTQVCEGI